MSRSTPTFVIRQAETQSFGWNRKYRSNIIEVSRRGMYDVPGVCLKKTRICAWRNGMTALQTEAVSIDFTDDQFIVTLSDGR